MPLTCLFLLPPAFPPLFLVLLFIFILPKPHGTVLVVQWQDFWGVGFSLVEVSSCPDLVWEQRVHQLPFREQCCTLPVAKTNRFTCCLDGERRQFRSCSLVTSLSCRFCNGSNVRCNSNVAYCSFVNLASAFLYFCLFMCVWFLY